MINTKPSIISVTSNIISKLAITMSFVLPGLMLFINRFKEKDMPTNIKPAKTCKLTHILKYIENILDKARNHFWLDPLKHLPFPVILKFT